MVEITKKEFVAKIAVSFFVLMTIWWVWIFTSGARETQQNYLFGALYGLMALWGGAWGIVIARKWGSFSSTIGTSIIVLSLGLLAQEFGQLVFSYYNIFLGIEIPYPSIADAGFFGSILLYIYGIFLLARASGIKFSLNTLVNQVQVVLIPLVILALSYSMFIRGYELDYSDPLRIFFDFGYPLGEAAYISLAILTYSLSRNLLGGIMRNKILFIVVAFIMQYIAEFNFLFQSSRGTWINGGYGDYLYLFAYFVMTLGLIRFKTTADDLERSA